MASPHSALHDPWTRHATPEPPQKRRRLMRGLRPDLTRARDENQDPALAYASPISPATPKQESFQDEQLQRESLDEPPSVTRTGIAALELRFGASPQVPAHPVFACGWEGCSAKLHNLTTLQQHLNKRHCRKQDEHYICLWTNCVSTSNRLLFDTDGEWTAHMWHSHVAEIAWRLGDGPRAGFIDPDVWKEQIAVYPPLSIATQGQLRQHSETSRVSAMHGNHRDSASTPVMQSKHDRNPAATSNRKKPSRISQRTKSPPMVISLLSDEEFIDLVISSD